MPEHVEARSYAAVMNDHLSLKRFERVYLAQIDLAHLRDGLEQLVRIGHVAAEMSSGPQRIRDVRDSVPWIGDVEEGCIDVSLQLGTADVLSAQLPSF